MITIKINHQEIVLPNECDITQALTIYGLQEKIFAVVLNNKIIPRENHQQIIIQADDQLDIIVPMQGG